MVLTLCYVTLCSLMVNLKYEQFYCVETFIKAMKTGHRENKFFHFKNQRSGPEALHIGQVRLSDVFYIDCLISHAFVKMFQVASGHTDYWGSINKLILNYFLFTNSEYMSLCTLMVIN